jgi:hypothetical protein
MFGHFVLPFRRRAEVVGPGSRARFVPFRNYLNLPLLHPSTTELDTVGSESFICPPFVAGALRR